MEDPAEGGEDDEWLESVWFSSPVLVGDKYIFMEDSAAGEQGSESGFCSKDDEYESAYRA